MIRLADLLPSPQAREPLTLLSSFSDIVAPLLCYYATAVLVLVPNTLAIRLAVLPLSLWTFFNGATRLDLVKAYHDDRLVYLNQGLVIIFAALSMRIIVWSFQKKPFWRVKTLLGITPQFYAASPPLPPPKQIFAYAFDLSCNLRGCGWNWSRYLQTPQETRPTRSTKAFGTTTLIDLLLHVVLFDTFQYSIQWFAPTTLGSSKGGSIYETSLPPLLRYSRSTLVTFLAGMAVYCALQAGYHITTLFGVLAFGQDITLWPPAFDAPWLSTSLTEFWARRWHQLFRDMFVSLGGKPMSFLFGRAGGVLGAFLVSAILHDVGMWGMGRGTDFVRVGGFFIMNGIGVILEHTWRKFSGHRVDGWYGRAWVYLWIIGWGHMLVEAWATRGLIGSAFFPEYLRLTTHIFGPLPQY